MCIKESGNDETLEYLLFWAEEARSNGDPLGAIMASDKAINLNNSSSLAYYYRGVSKIELGKLEEAILDLSISLILNPNEINALRELSNVLFSVHNCTTALTIANKTIELTPDVDIYLLRSKIKKALGDTVGAYEDEKAASLTLKLDASYVDLPF
jgi:tetratricopeptide (TPR) repeat protein